MAIENDGTVLRGIERIFNQGSLTGLSEAQLLRRFAAGDEAAFEALVTRHGPMVLSVCRRSLFDHRDVEDAFQATFLVLIRKAEALRDGDLLGPWLHGVAYRVASRIRSRVIRRPTEERKGAQPEAVESAGDLERNELRGLLDEEIRRLPEKYRRPVVLCYLEGRTHEEAARRLRCSTGSVRGRLDRARRRAARPPDSPWPGARRRADLAGGTRRGGIRRGSGSASRRNGRHPGTRRDGCGGLGHRVGGGHRARRRSVPGDDRREVEAGGHVGCRNPRARRVAAGNRA